MIVVVRVADSRGQRPAGAIGTEVGDIVQILPDDHPFTETELGNPDWHFLTVTGLTAIEAEALTLPEVDAVTKRRTRMRTRGLNVALLARRKTLGRAAFLALVRDKVAG